MLGVVARMGEVSLAANAVVWQIWSLVSYSVDGFTHAVETLVGNYIGARDFATVKRVAGLCITWGFWLGVGYSIVYALAIGPIGRAFTDHTEVSLVVASLMPWVAFIQPLNAAVFIFDGIFIGANDTGYIFGAMALSALIFFLPAILVLVYVFDYGLSGAWMGYNCLMIGRFITLYPCCRGEK